MSYCPRCKTFGGGHAENCRERHGGVRITTGPERPPPETVCEVCGYEDHNGHASDCRASVLR